MAGIPETLNSLISKISNHYVKGFLAFLLIFLISWLIISIFKHLFHRFFLKMKAEHSSRMLRFLIVGIFFYAVRVGLGMIFYNRTILLSLESAGIFFFFLAVINLVRALLSILRKNFKILKFEDAGFNTIEKIIVFILYFLCLVVILSLWGAKIGPLLTGLGIFGIVIGLALQSTLTDLFSGISMMLDKTLKVNDVVEISDVFGEVMDISFRAIKIKTYNNEIVTIPNSKVASSVIKNFSRIKPRRVVLNVNVEYGEEIERVKKTCLEAIDDLLNKLNKEKKAEIVLNKPTPSVYLVELGDYFLKFRVFLWVADQSFVFSIEDMLRTAVYNAFNKAGINFAFPTQVLHLKKDGVLK